MTLQEFYDRIGGDYKATISRLPSEALIKKFVLKYPGDPSFNQLKDALAAQDWELAFRASHTLKGVAATLGANALAEAARRVDESLRQRPDTDPESLKGAMAEVTAQLGTLKAALGEAPPAG